VKLQVAALGFLAAFLGGLTSYFLILAFGGISAGSPVDGASLAVSQDLRRLHAVSNEVRRQVDALVTRIDGLRDTGMASSDAASVRTPVREAASGLSAARLGEMATKADVQRIEAALLRFSRQGAVNAHAAPLAERRSADWQALDQLQIRRDQDRYLAGQSVLFMTIPEVVQAYGLPTSAGKGSLVYENDEMTLQLVFRISNGYVVGLE